VQFRSGTTALDRGFQAFFAMNRNFKINMGLSHDFSSLLLGLQIFSCIYPLKPLSFNFAYQSSVVDCVCGRLYQYQKIQKCQTY
jgi:hypothetical protein